MNLAARLTLLAAGLSGAAGVAFAAAAAHLTGGVNLMTAADFLLLHAAGALGFLGLARCGGRAGTSLAIAAALMLAGAWLFAGDLAMRELAGVKLLWGTAPFGGTILIVAWLMGTVAALLRTGA